MDYFRYSLLAVSEETSIKKEMFRKLVDEAQNNVKNNWINIQKKRH